MDAKRILNYLKQLMANNNREWYWANKAEYDAIRADFEEHQQFSALYHYAEKSRKSKRLSVLLLQRIYFRLCILNQFL